MLLPISVHCRAHVVNAGMTGVNIAVLSASVGPLLTIYDLRTMRDISDDECVSEE